MLNRQTTARIQADFDRIALLSDDADWNHNSHYHTFLLKQLPAHLEDALDIGCGAGAFSRLLAKRSHHVLGLDLSPEMIRIARQSSASYPNIDYQQANVMEWDFPPEQFDCVVSIATLHHLPLADILVKMRGSLKPGGTLLVLDLFKYSSPIEMLVGGLAMPAGIALRLMKGIPLHPPPEVQRAWDEHGRYDVYPRFAEVLRVCEDLLAGARVRRHLFYRYSIVWKKPMRYSLSTIAE